MSPKGQRTAILVANQNFHPESDLSSLHGPLNDVAGLANVLGSPPLGGFTVRTFVNSTSFAVKSAIEEELTRAGPDDLVLIYYTGHGRLDRLAHLCLATADTRSDALQATSIPSRHICEFVEASDCRTVVLILDCCYSGVATNGTRGTIEDQLNAMSDTSGFYIISASSAVQPAYETEFDGVVFGEFTAAFLEGLRSSSADYDNNGLITLHELFRYVKSRLKKQSPRLYSANASVDPVICLLPDRTPLLAAAPRSENEAPETAPHRDFRLKLVKTIHHPDRVVDIAFSRDDYLMSTVCDDGKVRTFSTRDFSQVGLLKSQPHSLRSASWSKGGREIATADSKGHVLLWRDGGCVGEMISKSRGLTWVQYSPNGLALATGCEDGKVALWRPQQRKLLWEVKVHSNIVSSVRFSADGRWLVSASYDGQAVVLDVKDGSILDRFTRHSDQLTSAFFIEREDEPISCVSAGLNGEICLWNIAEPDSAYVATKHPFWVTALAYLPDANTIVSGGYESSIKLMDLSTGHLFEGAKVEGSPVISVRNSFDEQTLAISTYEGQVHVLSLSF